jgi:hypothetical protein
MTATALLKEETEAGQMWSKLFRNIFNETKNKYVQVYNHDKTVLMIKDDVKTACGNLHLCICQRITLAICI